MKHAEGLLLSVVVPLYNEQDSLEAFNESLLKAIRAAAKDSYEVIYVNDGSTDNSPSLVKSWAAKDKKIKLLSLSRNFGKEIATTAGIHQAAGQAIITIDADGQHPPELISRLMEKWRAGSQVVIGFRTLNQKEGLIKRWGSKLFYAGFNKLAGFKMLRGATDYRLIDHKVQADFIKMTERNRITRGLIDWLGYKRDYVDFQANPRASGQAGYSFKKLVKLAIDSTISLSISPLYISAYIGAVVLPLSVILGIGMILESLVGDPLNLNITGSAYVVVLLLFLVGILLISQGIIGLYLSHIHAETQNRPLYIIDKSDSENIND